MWKNTWSKIRLLCSNFERLQFGDCDLRLHYDVSMPISSICFYVFKSSWLIWYMLHLHPPKGLDNYWNLLSQHEFPSVCRSPRFFYPFMIAPLCVISTSVRLKPLLNDHLEQYFHVELIVLENKMHSWKDNISPKITYSTLVFSCKIPSMMGHFTMIEDETLGIT